MVGVNSAASKSVL